MYFKTASSFLWNPQNCCFSDFSLFLWCHIVRMAMSSTESRALSCRVCIRSKVAIWPLTVKSQPVSHYPDLHCAPIRNTWDPLSWVKCLSLPRIWVSMKMVYRRRYPGDVPKGMSTLLPPFNKPRYPAREDQLQKLFLYRKRNKLRANWHLGLELHFREKITAACKEKREEEWGGWKGLLALLPYPSGVAWCAHCWLQCPRAGSPWTRRFRDQGSHWQHRASWLCGPFPPPSAAGPCQWLGSQLGGGLLQEGKRHKVKEKHSQVAMEYGWSDSSATLEHLCLCWKTAAWLPYWEGYQALKAH